MKKVVGIVCASWYGEGKSLAEAMGYVTPFFCTHGPHQVAQKSSTTRFPLSSLNLTVLPSIVVTVRSGARTPSHCWSALPPLCCTAEVISCLACLKPL